MSVKLWRNSDGKLLVGDEGNPILCDDCPCGDPCDALASSYTVRFPSAVLHVVTKIYVFTLLPDCVNEEIPLCRFGKLYTAGKELKLSKRTGSPFWTIYVDNCVTNFAKTDAIDHPVGTYASGFSVS